MGFCKGIENYSRHLSGRKPGEPPPTLIDYLPPDALMIIDESHVTIGAARRHVQGRPLAQGEPGRLRLPAALGAGQPAAQVRGVRAGDAPDGLRLGDAGGLRAPARRRRWWSRWCARPGWSIRSLEVRPASTQVDDLLSEINLRVARDERVLVTTLTKRMAEDLTDYLARARRARCATCIRRSRRWSAWRSSATCAWASSTCWSASTCCARASTLPEVSLVAILDADKEGFLRSERSLIQTIGRAARHINGTAILYADRMTDSMKRAIGETERRRAKQIALQPERTASRRWACPSASRTSSTASTTPPDAEQQLKAARSRRATRR